jgi:hypothetical protein
VVRSRLRFGAGVCVLAAGLLMGGGAVAVADPDSGGSPNGDDGTNASVQGGTASSPVGKITGTLPKTLQDVASTVGSGQQPSSVTSTVGSGQQPSSVTSTVGSGRQPGQQPSSVTSTVGSDPQPGQQPSTGAKSPKKEPGGTGSGRVAAVPDPVAAVPNVVASVPNLVAPVTDVVAPVTDVVASVPNLVAPVTDVVAPVTDVVASVPNLVAPGSDAIGPVQDISTSVAGAVPLTQPQSDLSAFLVSIAGVGPVGDGSGGIHGPGLSAAAGASVASQLPLGPPLAGIPGVPLAGNATGVATLDVNALGRASALSGMAPLAPEGAIPMGVEPFFQHVFSGLLLPASLWALANIALPGAAGLVILTAAGVRVGYRQAKAGFAVRAAGTARSASLGPLGVVRPGSLVVVRPRALRVVPSWGR